MSSYEGEDGLTGTLAAPLPIITIITSFTAIAWYNVIVINVAIWFFFKRWSGLYFYSLLFASWGIVLHELGFLMQAFALANVFAESYTVMTVGWYPMVIGQAVVLYSRLHLVSLEKHRYRWVLYMIIANTFLIMVPTTTFLAYTNSNPQLVPDYDIWQNIHITALSIQEFIISGLYISEARKILRPADHIRREKVRQVMKRLIYVNVLVIILDIAVMGTQYAGMYQVHVPLKGAIYSVKLVLEFFVLNQLADVSSAGLLTDVSDPDSSYSNQGATRHSSGNSERALGESCGQDQNHASRYPSVEDGARGNYVISSSREKINASHTTAHN